MINWILYIGIMLVVMSTAGYVSLAIQAMVNKEGFIFWPVLILYAIGIYLIMLGVK